MDEEYDVIVLGTGLTVSRSISFSAYSDVSYYTCIYLVVKCFPWMWLDAWASRSGRSGRKESVGTDARA